MAKSRSLVWNVVFFLWIWGIFGSTAGHLLVVWWPAKLLKKLRFLRIQKPATWPSLPARKSWLKSTLFPKPQGIECFLRNFPAKRGWFGKWNKEVFVFPVKTSQFSPAPSVTGTCKTYPRLCLSMKWKVKRCQQFGLCDAVLWWKPQ